MCSVVNWCTKQVKFWSSICVKPHNHTYHSQLWVWSHHYYMWSVKKKNDSLGINLLAGVIRLLKNIAISQILSSVRSTQIKLKTQINFLTDVILHLGNKRLNHGSSYSFLLLASNTVRTISIPKLSWKLFHTCVNTGKKKN